MAVAVLRLPFGVVVDFVAIQGVTRRSCHLIIAFTPIWFIQRHALMSVFSHTRFTILSVCRLIACRSRRFSLHYLGDYQGCGISPIQ